MKIISLVENQSHGNLKPKHGLALYIKTHNHKLLFDLGPDETLLENAKLKGIDLAQVDTVILSHGHVDHGGALKAFLQINQTAKVYVQAKAFEPHYSKHGFIKVSIGLEENLQDHPQIVLVDGDWQIDEELMLFTAKSRAKGFSTANKNLYDKNGPDTFEHEQNLLIQEQKTAIIMGCGHSGVLNILESMPAQKADICIGGFHLYSPTAKKTVAKDLLDEIAQGLTAYPNTVFYTCHCTGKEAFSYLANKLENVHYLSCGEEWEIE